jgi:hypothetical protein
LRELIYLKAAKSDLTQLLTYLAREAGSVPTAQAFVTGIRELPKPAFKNPSAKALALAQRTATVPACRPALQNNLVC